MTPGEEEEEEEEEEESATPTTMSSGAWVPLYEIEVGEDNLEDFLGEKQRKTMAP